MTTAHHDPHVFGAPLTAAEMNAPLADLDAAIDVGDTAEAAVRALAVAAEAGARAIAIAAEAATRAVQDAALQAAIDALAVSGSGVTTPVNGAGAASGQKVVPTTPTTGYTVGDSAFLVNTAGASETGVIASISAGVSLTMVANLTNTYAAGSTVSKSPAEIVLSRSTIDAVYASLYQKLLYVRKALTANTTYYVRADGNDANTGSANVAGSAWLTIQRAVDYVKNRLDLNGFNVTISVFTGTYTTPTLIRGPWHGKGYVTILESGTVNIATTTGHCFEAAEGAEVFITGFKCTTTGGSYDAYMATNGATIWASPREVGAVSHSHFECQGRASYINILTGYTISGGGVSHYHGGTISIGAVTVTLTGTPNFTAYFAGLSSSGYQQIIGVTFSGAATGKRFVVHNSATIDCGGAAITYLPGNSPGSTDTGGFYKGDQYDVAPFLQTSGWCETTSLAGGSYANLFTSGNMAFSTVFATSGVARVNSAAAINVQGIEAPAVSANKEFMYENTSAFSHTFKHNDGAAAAGRSIRCPGGTDYVLPAFGTVRLIYDGLSTANNWRIVSN